MPIFFVFYFTNRDKQLISDAKICQPASRVYTASHPRLRAFLRVTASLCISQRVTILGFTGKGGTVFWFVFEDLGRDLPFSKSPRYKNLHLRGETTKNENRRASESRCEERN